MPLEDFVRAAASSNVGQRIHCGTRYERRGWRDGHGRIAGLDEVGRGALFGPVVAAAVILDPKNRIRGLRDSKQLSPARREQLAGEIRRRALAWSLASVDAAEIDRINILQASRQAMSKAALALDPPPDLLLIDALRLDLTIPQIPIIRGDAVSVSIAAASILAKVTRDAMMREWDSEFPQYHLANNKGYATADHRAGLRAFGPSPLHRRSYAPVAAAIRNSPKALFLFPELRETGESSFSPPPAD